MSKANGHSSITAEQLRALKPLMAGDFYWGHKHADKLPNGEDDATDLTIHTAHHAAMRGGVVEKGSDVYDFLDRVELDVLTQIFGKEVTEDESGPLAEPTGT